MSDNFISVIPADPWFLSDVSVHQTALEAIKQYAPNADTIEIFISDRPQFVDCGVNLEKIACPECGMVLNEWWQTAMEQAAKRHFIDLTVTTPCCGVQTSLNELLYDWPAGFARFVLEARNPNIGLLSVSQIRELQQILGCRVRQILAHI
ncbi:MAG TPA: hypothetical protein VFT66_23845 [Roseiflexaceae bacterium]|nr:hypothetical protein [Roseiflexaceae bacterium]